MKKYFFILILSLLVSCTSRLNIINDVKIIDEQSVFIERGIENIFFINNRLFLCFNNTGEIKEVFINSQNQIQYINTFNIGPYEQIDIKDNYILYLSSEDWFLHRFNIETLKDETIDRNTGKDFYLLSVNGDYIKVNKSGQKITEVFGNMEKSNSLFYNNIIQEIKYKNGLLLIKSENSITVSDVSGAVLNEFQCNASDFDLFNGLIACIKDNELKFIKKNFEKSFILNNDFDLIITNNSKILLYNKNTGQLLLKDIYLY